MNTLNIQFFLRPKARKGQPVPYMRVTVNSMPAILKSLKVVVTEQQWDAGRGMVKGHGELAIKVNDTIKRMARSVEEAFGKLDINGHYITGEELREATYPSKHKSKKLSENTLLVYFKKYMQHKRERGILETSLKVSQQVYNKLVKLLTDHYQMSDMHIEKIDPYILINFSEKFPCAKGTMQNRINVLTSFFKWLEGQSRRMRHSQDPEQFMFVNDLILLDFKDLVYKCLYDRALAGCHTRKEHQQLKQEHFRNQDETIGLYLFQIETGMSYADLAAFRLDEHVVKDIGGEYQISKRREKFRRKNKQEHIFTVPISELAKSLMDTYATEGRFSALIGGRSSYRKYARDLDRISKRLGFVLHPHKARHTFGTFRLEEGYSMSVVQKMMGHSDMKSTMIYAKMTNMGVWDEHRRVQKLSHQEKPLRSAK